MERILEVLFDYQRFAGNQRLRALIADTERRCVPRIRALSDERLDLYAAGEPNLKPEKGDTPDG